MANMTGHDKNLLNSYFANLGRKGAKARAKALTATQRVEIARKASAAAAAKRSAKKPA
jgi:hypothetical protein